MGLKMKSIIAFFASIIVAITFSTSARSDDTSDWAADKARLEQLVNEGRCEGYWDVLWPWAKKGNDEARELLLMSLVPPPHMDGICSPGSTCDWITQMRDATVMAVHSSPFSRDAYAEAARFVFEEWEIKKLPQGKDFIHCALTENAGDNAADCASIAVNANISPSFDEYAQQIDAMIANGLKSRCHSHKHTR